MGAARWRDAPIVPVLAFAVQNADALCLQTKAQKQAEKRCPATGAGIWPPGTGANVNVRPGGDCATRRPLGTK